MSAVTERSRRNTAGRRMNNLVGKAAEDDAAFWNHDTWGEEGEDDGNDSYNDSDEDSEIRKDAFDSDFNDSETDNEQDEVAAGEAEEKRLQREEKMARRNKAIDAARAGRELLQKKRGKIKGNRIFGDGANAGLVLNFPIAGGACAARPAKAAPFRPSTAPVAATSPSKKSKVTLASTRSRRGKKHLRNSTQESSKISISEAATAKAGARPGNKGSKRARAHRFTQEELLLEAATDTEQKNARWLLGRKRLHQQAEATRAQAASNTSQQSTQLLQRFVSKRGSVNTINFTSMEHVPKIIVKTQQESPKPTKATACVVTGKQARYRDPKTKMAYFDLAAFKELRQRLEAGESLDKRPKKAAVIKSEPKAVPVTPKRPIVEEMQLDSRGGDSTLTMTTRRAGKRAKASPDAVTSKKARTTAEKKEPTKVPSAAAAASPSKLAVASTGAAAVPAKPSGAKVIAETVEAIPATTTVAKLPMQPKAKPKGVSSKPATAKKDAAKKDAAKKDATKKDAAKNGNGAAPSPRKSSPSKPLAPSKAAAPPKATVEPLKPATPATVLATQVKPAPIAVAAAKKVVPAITEKAATTGKKVETAIASSPTRATKATAAAKKPPAKKATVGKHTRTAAKAKPPTAAASSAAAAALSVKAPPADAKLSSESAATCSQPPRMSPNTLVNTALAAYVKLQDNDETK